MSIDPLEDELDANLDKAPDFGNVIDTVETSNQWTQQRDALALEMYNEWRANVGQDNLIYAPDVVFLERLVFYALNLCIW